MSPGRRSTGTTRTSGEIFTAYRRGAREKRQKGDIEAVDSGVTVTLVGSYKGNYGKYPKRFMMAYIDLNEDGIVIRPMLFFGQYWRKIPVSERVISARVRPFLNKREAFSVRGGGQYAAGGILEQTGNVAISCTTSGGVLDLAVPRPDVEMVLHYLSRLAGNQIKNELR